MTTALRTRARRSHLSKARAGLENLESRMLLSAVTGYAFDAVNTAWGITHDNVGNLYVTDFQGTIDKITVDGAGNPVSATAFDAAGPSGGFIVFNPVNNHLYYNDNGGNIDEMDTNGNLINSFAIPDAQEHSPVLMTVATDGAIWFAAGTTYDTTNGFGGSVVRMDMAGNFTEQDLALHNTSPVAVGAAADGSIWVGVQGAENYSDVGDSSLVHATYSGGTISYTDYAIPQPEGVIGGLTVAGDGSVWYTNQNVVETPDPRPTNLTDQIGHAVLSGSTLSVTTYNVPESASEGNNEPVAPHLDTSGRLWFAEAGHISYLDTATGQFTRLATGDSGAVSSDLTVTSQGAYMATPGGSYNLEAVTFGSFTAPISSSAPNIAATAGAPFSGAVATVDSSSTGDFSYSLDYGDGNVDTGSFSSNGSGVYTINGAQTYPTIGSYGTVLTVTDAAGDVSTFNGTATVTSGVSSSPLAAQGINVSGPEQAPLAANVSGISTLVVASFSGPAASYSATINWGDSTSSTGVIVAKSGGGYYVTLASGTTKTYAQQGNYTITVSITDGTHSATATSTATISDTPLVVTANTPIKPILGSIALSTVATFTDDLSSTASWFKATITWGDGSTSTGLVIRTSAGHYSVLGLHVYLKKGTFNVNVLVDNLVENVTASVTDTITITKVL